MKNQMLNFIGILFTLFGCTNRDTVVNKRELTGYDYRLFQNTPGWGLAKAVEDGNVNKIKELVNKNRILLDFREPRFGQSLLKLAVMNENFKSVRALVELGADPNMQDNFDGSSPLMEAAKIGGGGNHSGADSRYLKFLIEHGGDVNAEEKGVRQEGNAVRQTPLLIACYEGNYEYVKLLVDAGANVNYTNEFGENTLDAAISVGRNPDVVIFLLEKGANYKEPMFTNSRGEKEYISDVLRLWCFDLGSENYKKKMQIVEFLKKNGIDYRKSEIPKGFFKQYDKEYLEKY